MPKKQTKKTDDQQEKVFLKEVKEEVYKEQLQNLLKKYSKQIGIVVAIVVVLVLGSVISNNSRVSKEEKYSKELYEAILDVKKHQYEEAQKSLESILKSSIPSGTKSLVELKLAQVLNLQGEYKKSLELYMDVKNDRKYDTFVREFAGLSALNLMIVHENLANGNGVQKLIKQLKKNKNGSLKYLVMEQEALYLRIKGDLNASNTVIKEIMEDVNAPHTIKLRVMEMKEVNSFIESQRK